MRSHMPDFPDVEAVADVVRSTVKAHIAPLAARLTATESELARTRDTLDTFRERLVGIETKSHAPIDLTPLFERVAVLETRAPVPGPPGPAGKDGTAGLRYRDRFIEGASYNAGDIVTWDGSGWVCVEDTSGRPGTVSAWRLFVKHGRDGKDAGAR